MDKTQPHPLFKLATELGPLIVFFVINAKFNLFAATGAFMVAIVAAMIASYVVTKHIPMMALVTGVIVLVFGTLTLGAARRDLHQDEADDRLQPVRRRARRRAFVRPLLHRHHVRSDVQSDGAGWRVLTFRWAIFFLAMAILNEIIWRTQTTDFWVAFKAFGVIPLTMGFAITQMPLIKRYHLEPASLEASEAEAGDISKG